MSPRVKSVRCLDSYKVLITFENDEKKVFDLQPYLHLDVYRPLQYEVFFKRVTVRQSDGVLQWSDLIDLDPDRTYMESTPIS